MTGHKRGEMFTAIEGMREGIILCVRVYLRTAGESQGDEAGEGRVDQSAGAVARLSGYGCGYE